MILTHFLILLALLGGVVDAAPAYASRLAAQDANWQEAIDSYYDHYPEQRQNVEAVRL